MEPLVATLAGGFDRNLCYVVGCPRTRDGVLIDAGIRVDDVLEAFAGLGVRPVALAITHGHGDHLSEGTEFVRRTGVSVHAYDPHLRARLGASRFAQLADGDALEVGEVALVALHTPGHSPDSMCFHVGGLLFSGDTLFVGRTGRTISGDSSVRDLFRSVQRLKGLDPATVVHPGHDYGSSRTTTIGRELRENAFLQVESEEEFVRVMERFESERRRT